MKSGKLSFHPPCSLQAVLEVEAAQEGVILNQLEERRGHALNQEDRELRLVAVRASKGKIGDDALVTALIPRPNDKDDTTLDEAAKTLSKLLQQRIDGLERTDPPANRAETVQRWQEWWKKKRRASDPSVGCSAKRGGSRFALLIRHPTPLFSSSDTVILLI